MTIARTVAVRPAVLDDVPRVTALCVQLGYPSREEDVERRLRWLQQSDTDTVLVAVLDDRVVGWIHLRLHVTVESGPDVEVAGLVVDEAHRGAGIGRVLMREADRWGAARGCGHVRLRSRVVRADAHAFYQHLGFRILKTQHAFIKEIT